MQNLWAPWRMQFIKAMKTGKKLKCIFCAHPKDTDGKNFILWRGRHTFVMLNLFPYNPGHLMVAPFRHITDMEDLTEEEALEHNNAIEQGVALLKKVMKPDGFNIGTNLGKVAGAGFGHLHAHVVPRWSGDENFMPVIAHTKVVPEALEATYKKLKKAMQKW